MHKILRIVYGMLKNDSKFSPETERRKWKSKAKSRKIKTDAIKNMMRKHQYQEDRIKKERLGISPKMVIPLNAGSRHQAQYKLKI